MLRNIYETLRTHTKYAETFPKHIEKETFANIGPKYAET